MGSMTLLLNGPPMQQAEFQMLCDSLWNRAANELMDQAETKNDYLGVEDIVERVATFLCVGHGFELIAPTSVVYTGSAFTGINAKPEKRPMNVSMQEDNPPFDEATWLRLCEYTVRVETLSREHL